MPLNIHVDFSNTSQAVALGFVRRMNSRAVWKEMLKKMLGRSCSLMQTPADSTLSFIDLRGCLETQVLRWKVRDQPRSSVNHLLQDQIRYHARRQSRQGIHEERLLSPHTRVVATLLLSDTLVAQSRLLESERCLKHYLAVTRAKSGENHPISTR